MAKRAEEIRRAVLQAVFWRSASPVRRVAEQFGVTPQAVQLHVQRLVREEHLLARGERRHRRYKLAVLFSDQQSYPLDGSVTEDRIWERQIRGRIGELTTSEQEICHYGLTEMVNNALDHSDGRNLTVKIEKTAISVSLTVVDDGIGIFQKIAEELDLIDPRQSLLELSKGKFTTDPARHTGEGVFFTSRSFDRFSIRSSDLLFWHSSRTDGWLVETEDKQFVGTRVAMNLILPAARTLEAVFQKYSSGPDDHRFAKTHVPLKLATYGDEALISRSSARRVLSRVDRFDEVLLDFSAVRSIGQAFADEIFRVFANKHPKIQLISINANEQVTGMIRRAEAARREREG